MLPTKVSLAQQGSPWAPLAIWTVSPIRSAGPDTVSRAVSRKELALQHNCPGTSLDRLSRSQALVGQEEYAFAENLSTKQAMVFNYHLKLAISGTTDPKRFVLRGILDFPSAGLGRLRLVDFLGPLGAD